MGAVILRQLVLLAFVGARNGFEHTNRFASATGGRVRARVF